MLININNNTYTLGQFIYIQQITAIVQMLKGKQNRSSKPCIPQYTQGSIEDYIQILYNHQKLCEKSGKYLDADLAKKKIVQIKEQLQRQKKFQMLQKHESEKGEVEAAHKDQMYQFNKYWDDKMSQYQQQASRLQQQTLSRHDAQMEKYHEQIQKSLSFKLKETSQLINLRRIEENLVKQQNYIEAHKVQKQIQELQKSQYDKLNQSRTNKIRNLLIQLKNKQENEINALRQRIQQGFFEQKKIRSSEQQKLIQKYMNLVKQVENHHHQEKMKLDKTSKLQSNANFLRQSTTISRVSQRN